MVFVCHLSGFFPPSNVYTDVFVKFPSAGICYLWLRFLKLGCAGSLNLSFLLCREN